MVPKDKGNMIHEGGLALLNQMDREESEPPLHGHALRLLELRLLRCTFSTATPPPPPLSTAPELLTNFVQLIEAGSYVEALSSSGLFDSSTSLADSPDSFFSVFLPDWLNSKINFRNAAAADDDDSCCKVFLLFIVAVAAFLAFTQCNIIGPYEKLPGLPKLATTTTIQNEGSSEEQWESWAQKEIMLAGSELLGKFHSLQYIVFAKNLLMRVKDLLLDLDEATITLKSISWWLSRVLLVQQRLLDGLSSSLFDQIQFNMNSSLLQFGTFESLIEYWSPKLSEEDGLAIVSLIHLEAGLIDLTYARMDSSGNHFEAAQLASKLDFSVSGAMGFRTIHQVEPKAQLKLLVTSDCCVNGVDDSVGNDDDDDDSLIQHSPETYEASDVLMVPKIVEDRSGATQLKPLQQVVILAKCLAIEKSSRNDEYQQYKMGPYIEAIDSQRTSNFLIKHLCNILRVRWESTRSRTKQRAIMMMEKLVEAISEPSPGVSERLYYCFALNIPTFSALRKDYGDLLVSCGLIGEALKVYEDLELWDNLIYCYTLMEKKAAAVDLIKTELTKRPQDPRLWCSFGDVTNDESYYEKALEVSGNNSARALRSLARSAYNKGDYEKSKGLWKSAMKLNSLYQDGWFALGAAALKARDVDLALDGFTRAVQLDPENGEAWNNIACLHMVKKRNKEAFVAFKEALKLKRNSWQMWENFSHVAADVGNYSQAMEAINTVLDMSKNKRIDVDLLERLMTEFEKTNIKTRESDMFTELLGKILRKIVQGGGSSGGEIWGLYARWHKLKGDLTMCSEALLKQVRAYQGSDVWTDSERFKKFAHASLELCKVYQEISLRNDSRKRELFAAEMHLKGVIKQAVKFSDSQEYRDLLACLNEVQKKLEVSSVAAAV